MRELERLTSSSNQAPLCENDERDVTAQLQALKRCHDLHKLSEELYDYLKDLVEEHGCVEHQVYYEQKDAACRGRLYAVARQVKVFSDKHPRNTALQGMHKDLRNLLTGAFSHEIDCDNSEVRLLCSLAKQLQIDVHLIPNLLDYRERKKHWRNRIAQAYNVSEEAAKRLPLMMLNGGRIRGWLRKVGMPPCKGDVERFAFGLQKESELIRDTAMQHPRFKWTTIEREKMEKQGQSRHDILRKMLPRITEVCESTVLNIIHRAFFEQGWHVRAKVFDGLIAERGEGAVDLASVIAHTEANLSTASRTIRFRQSRVVAARAALNPAWQIDSGMICMCTDATQDENFSRNLFGLTSNRLSELQQIGDSTALFLLNTRRRELFGVYVRCGPAGLNLEPEAWTNARHSPSVKRRRLATGSPYPSQIRFKPALAPFTPNGLL
eukprot:2752305-Prymnesium_polylepis.1